MVMDEQIDLESERETDRNQHAVPVRIFKAPGIYRNGES